MKKSTKWNIAFLGIAGAWLIMELYGAFAGKPEFQPLTGLIITYIPMWIGLPIIIGFAIWLIYHFVYWYKKVQK